MKKAIFMILVFAFGSCFTADAQKKKTYIKDLKFKFEGGGKFEENRDNSETSWKPKGPNSVTECNLEIEDKCEMRATVQVNKKKMGVMGRNYVQMQSKVNYPNQGPFYRRKEGETRTTATFQTKENKENLYLGEFEPNEEFEIVFDIWEDDDLWGYGWVFDGSDDQCEDTETKASASKGHISHVKKRRGAYQYLILFIRNDLIFLKNIYLSRCPPAAAFFMLRHKSVTVRHTFQYTRSLYDRFVLSINFLNQKKYINDEKSI